MKTKRRTSFYLAILLACLVSGILSTLWLYPKVKQARLNQALLDATKQSNYIRIQALLDAGADPNSRDNGYPTVLILAADKNDEATVRLLLSHKANVNATGAYGSPALQYAINNYYQRNADKYPSVIALLLEHGANPNLANGKGQTSIEEAKQLHSFIAPEMRLDWQDEALPLLNRTKS